MPDPLDGWEELAAPMGTPDPLAGWEKTAAPDLSQARAQTAKQTLSDYRSSAKGVGDVLKGLAYNFTVAPFVEAGKVLSGPSPTERAQALSSMTPDERVAYLESGRGSMTPLEGLMSSTLSDQEKVPLMSPLTGLGMIGALGTKSVGGVPHGFDRGFFTRRPIPPPPTRPLLALPPARPLQVTPEGQVVTPRTVGGVVKQMPEGQPLPFGLTPQEITAAQKRISAPVRAGKMDKSGITVTAGQFPERVPSSALLEPSSEPALRPITDIARTFERISNEISATSEEITKLQNAGLPVPRLLKDHVQSLKDNLTKVEGNVSQLHAGLPIPENVKVWLKRFSGRTPLAGQETSQRPSSEFTPPVMTRPPGMSEGQWIRAQRRPVGQPTAEAPPPPGVPSTPLPVSTPFQLAQQRIIDAIKTAKPVRAETERLYSQERGKRLGAALEVGKTIPGEEGFHAQLGQLRGELPKATFEPIRGSIDVDTVKTLFSGIRESRAISGFDQITAQRGLAKLLGDYGGVVPTRGELELLGRVFPPEFVKTVLAKRGLFPRLLDMTAEALAIPKALMASMDLSASMRQGLTAIAPFPRQWGRAFLDQFRYFGSERAYESMIQEIEARPAFENMRRSKLALSAVDGTSLTGREEQFMSTLPERIPGIGHMVRASDRAYTGFLTKFRADAFEEVVRRAQQAGTEVTEKLMADAAKYVNTATGRGSLGAFEAAGSALSTAFFSPRLMASRFNLLNPVFYTKLDPFVRKQALKGALGTVALGSAVLGLAKAGGAKVGSDPRNADFGKVRVGNTRWDVWAGLSHFPRIASQLITGKVVSSVTGRTLTLGEGYKPLTRKDIIARFFENKANPVVGFTLRMLEGRSFDGKPIKVSREVADLFTPMILQDMHDLYKDDPTLLPWATPAVFGVGVQTYGPKRAR